MAIEQDQMDEMERSNEGRRAVITGMGVAAAGLVVGAATAQAQSGRRGGGNFRPARHDLDAWMDEASGSHRVFVDSASPQGGAEALLYANNIFGAHANAYGGEASDLAMIVCFRHLSTPFGFGDAIWAKYGAAIQSIIQFPAGGASQAPTVNPKNSTANPALPNFGNTIDSLAARGGQFAICNNATQFFSGQLASATGASADDVYAELTAAVIPNGRFVPAGVIAVTRAQEYGYSLLCSG